MKKDQKKFVLVTWRFCVRSAVESQQWPERLPRQSRSRCRRRPCAEAGTSEEENHRNSAKIVKVTFYFDRYENLVSKVRGLIIF
jgi:hypothetical protein